MQNVYSSPGRYTQGPDVTDQLVSEMAFLGLVGPVLIVAGPTVTELLSERWKTIFETVGIPYAMYPFEGECYMDAIDALAESASISAVGTLLAAGGGKVIDTTRAAAANLNKPFICCPTVASTDSPCSAIAVVYNPLGVYETSHTCSRNPDLVLVDTEVIVQSPIRYFIAGMGDGLSTVFEARACVQSGRENLRGGRSTLAAAEIGELCYRTLMADGRAALADMQQRTVTPAFERVVEANTLLSGIGFESAGLAAAHGIHNAMTVGEGTHAYLHGEKVAFGVLVHLMLEEQPAEVFEPVVGFCRDVGLPTTLGGVGLDAADEATLRRIAEVASEPESLVLNEPFAITPQKVYDALLAADRVGCAC